MEKGHIWSEWQGRLLATRANRLWHNLPWEIGQVRSGKCWVRLELEEQWQINQQCHCPLCCAAQPGCLLLLCAPALHWQGVPIPQERHSANISTPPSTPEVFSWSQQGKVREAWALSGGAAALGEQGRRSFENCGSEPRCSNKVNNDDLWQDWFFAVWIFSLWLYQELWKVLLGAKGA